MKDSLRNIRGGLFAILVACGLSACVSDNIKFGGLENGLEHFGLGNLQKRLGAIDLFGDDTARYPVDAEELPIHLEAALTAAVMRLRGRSALDVRNETKVAGSEQIVPEAGFDYAGFAVVDVEVLKLDAPEDKPRERSAAGYLHFEDGNRRRAAVGFEIDYQVAGISPVVITRATLAPAFSPGARAVMYVVPGAAMEAGMPKVRTYGDFYRLVRTSAEPWVASATSAPAERVIVVLFEDRLPSGDRVEVGISKSRAGRGSHTAATRYVAFTDGWVVAMIPGSFALGPHQAFWVKAVHAPAAGGGKAVLVGLFSTDPTLTPSS
jgi:hypothetical protein